MITGQAAVVHSEAVEGAGAKQQHVLLRMDRLQLFQCGLPAPHALQAHGKSFVCKMRNDDMRVTAQLCFSYLALSPESSFLQPGPDALNPSGVLGVAAVVAARTLVLLHLSVIRKT